LKNEKLRIMFRTSGGKAVRKQLGIGHVNRCLSLSKALSDSKIFFLIEDYGGIKEFMDNKKIKMIYLKNNIPRNEDIQETKKHILEKKIDILVVDKYGVELNYLKKLKGICKIVVISDLKRIDFPVDLVINGFIGFNNIIKKNKYGTKCLLGPKFQILDERFERKSNSKKIVELLITFGGFDEKNIIEIALKELIKYNKKITTKVILGPSTKKSKNLQKILKKCSYVSIQNTTSDMKNEISSAKFGLCSGGITTYEFAKLSVPFAIICQERHQLTTAKEWEKLHIGYNLGLVNSTTGKKIEKFLSYIEKNEYLPKYKSQKLIDGLGCKRAANEILMLTKK